MSEDVYKKLAGRLDALPNGFPSTADGAELRVLAKLFTPEEAELAAQLRLTKESPEEVATRLGREQAEVRTLLKGMVRKGLIAAGRSESGLGFGLLPWVVGIYENQIASMDAEMAALFESYYKEAFGEMLRVSPQFHRVVPVRESIQVDIEVRPHESAADLVEGAQAWGVLDCICRKQKALIGEACEHPIDVCMTLSDTPHAFDDNPVIRALTLDEALSTLQRAADAGLVHSVSNNRKGVHYICNCCTCSCGILRGQAELGIANVVARSAYVNQVDDLLCNGCETCLDYCQFDALAMGDEMIVQVSDIRCVGCGVCVPHCPNEALGMVLRPEDQILKTPESLKDWGLARAAERGINLTDVL
jgi:Pyruvate/2-oxoacid:ferredoxin oxidoreductase delta subunit